MKTAKASTIVIFFMILVSVGCQNGKNVKIGILLPHLQNDRNKKEKVFLTERVQSLGGEALFASAEYDDKVQISQAKEFIAQGAKVLIINPVNYTSAAEIVRNAHDNGVKVIAYDRIIRNCNLDYYVSFDNEKVGYLMADYVTKLKPEGKYIIIGGDKTDQNAVWVNKGQMEVLQPLIENGKIKVLYSAFCESWAADNAKHEVEHVLRLNPEIVPDVIVSSSDGLAGGVLDALKENNLIGKVLVTGQDGTLKACQNILNGTQTMTVYKPIKKLSYNAVDLAIKLARKEKTEIAFSEVDNGFTKVRTIFYEPILVHKDNIMKTVVADGFHSEKDIFQN